MFEPLSIISKTDRFDPKEILSASMDAVVCFCDNVTKGQVLDAIGNGAKTLADVKTYTGACTSAKCKELSPRKR